MTIYVKVQDTKYPASITGRIHDSDWDNRSSKAIKIEMTYDEAKALFVDDVNWSIVEEREEIVEEVKEDGTTVSALTTVSDEYDNSEYSVAGDITDHRNGYVTLKMGKPTAEELLAIVEEAL